MIQSARHGGWALAIISLVAAGCHKEDAALLPVWSSQQAIYVPKSGGGNGFDSLALAAQKAENSLDKGYLTRVRWTPDRRAKATKQAASSISEVAVGVSQPVTFEFTPRDPFTPSPYARGWRIIGRSLVWRTQDECANANYDGATHDVVLATKFGFSLTGGDAMDASLGFATADDARRAIAPNLGKMGAGQLNALADGLQRALQNRPPLTQTFENEKQNMLRAVQFVQDSFLRNDFTVLKNQLGNDIRDTLDRLKDLKGKSSTKQAAYFQGFAAEANERARWLEAVSELPLEEKNRDPGPDLSELRPWRGFSRHFFGAGEPLLTMRNSTLARTRLLILQCRILAKVKSGQAAPDDLSGFSKDIRTDPYTGRDLMYKASGSEFKIYSVGDDLKDDGGETDKSYSSPDVTLESDPD